MSVFTIDHADRRPLARAWVIRAVVVVALAAMMIAGVVIGRATAASHGVPTQSPSVSAVSAGGRPDIPARPDLQGFEGLPKGLDGP